jgi:hypothetical protein
VTFEPIAPPRRRWVVPAVVAGAVLILAAGATGVLLYLDRGLTVQGTVRLHSDYLAVLDGYGGCGGQDGYADVTGGAPVAVLDPAGVVLQVGRLSVGHWSAQDECLFTFAVDVPAGKGNYGLEIGHRNVIRYSETELAQVLELTIGGND